MNLFIPYSNEGDVKIYSKKEIIEFLKRGGFQEIIYKKIQNSGYLVIAKKGKESMNNYGFFKGT